jgi:hypothetical protein
MRLLNKIGELFKINNRYILTFLIMALVFWINKAFPAEVVSSQKCSGGSCPVALENPVLGSEKPIYYVNDIFKSQEGEYYRISFQERSAQDASISIKLATALDSYQDIKTVSLKKSFKDMPQEVIFRSSGQFTDIVFKKNNPGDNADVSISNVLATKLNVSNENEFANFRETVRGEIDTDISDQKQIENSKSFSQLAEPNILGQVFKPQSDYISAVSFDMDIIKQGGSGGKKFRLELRDVDFDGEVADVGPDTLASLSFSLADLDKYRQEDGKYKFPLFFKLDQRKYYFIGFNSGRADSNQFNYIKIKGSGDSDSYAKGKAVVKHNGKTFSVGGDLYFETFGLKFKEVQGRKILMGAVIEDIGKGQGKYTYQPRGSIYDLADLESATEDLSFDSSKNIINGSTLSERNSGYVYKFDTIYPFKKITITAQQADISWEQANFSYSLDGEEWHPVPSYMKNEVLDPKLEIGQCEAFNLILNTSSPKKEIFLKVEPKEKIEGDKNYGIKNLKIEADLIMK